MKLQVQATAQAALEAMRQEKRAALEAVEAGVTCELETLM